MFYAPVPQNTTQQVFFETCTFPWSDQRIVGSGSRTGRYLDEMRILAGYVDRTKGKPVTLKGSKWSPCRAYSRRGVMFKPLGGVDIVDLYDSGAWWTRTVRGPGYLRLIDDFRLLAEQYNTAMPASIRNRLNTEVLLKVGQRKVNYGESIAEGRETVSMLARSASTLVRAVLAARKGQWHRVPGILGVQKRKLRSGASASEKWLSYQYGWMPLMGDIYDSYQLFDKGLRKGPQIFSAVRNLTDRSSAKRADSAFAKIYTDRSTVRNTAKVFYRLADNDLNQLHQLGLINPFEVAWAIVPFSFVVDWLLPVGSYLEALSARMGVSFVDGFYGRRVDGIVVAGNNFRASTFIPSSSTWRARTESFSYQRWVMPALPYPGLYVKSPFSTTHVTSALALLRQLWR